MKLLRILLAIIIPTLILISLSFIPDNPGTAYPPSPPNPTPVAPYEGLFVHATCPRVSCEWVYRAQQFPVDRFEVWFTDVEPEHGIWIMPAIPYFSNPDVDWWRTPNVAVYTFGHVWDVRCVGYHPFAPEQPVYESNIQRIDCTNFVIKSRVRMPVIIKARWR